MELRPAAQFEEFITSAFALAQAGKTDKQGNPNLLQGGRWLLRQQLIIASRQVKRPPFRPRERGVIVALSSDLKHWRCAVLTTS